MPRKKETEGIAGIIRDTLITKCDYKEDDAFVRKPITENYGIAFYDDVVSPLCICIYHKEESQFSNLQKKVIKEVLAREEFTESYHNAFESITDGKPEICATLRIKAFSGWEDQAIADWIVKLFQHFITTVELLELE
jgi:hypothetical protein